MPRRPLRVCQLLQALTLGGIERVVVDLSLGLDRRRFDPVVCCLDRLGELAGVLAEEGVPVVLERRRPGFDWRLFYRLALRLRSLRVDVLHMHNCTALFYGVAALLGGVRRLVYTEHDRIFPPRKVVAWVHRAFARATSGLCAVSEDVRRRLERFDGIDPRRVTVVFNGVDGRRFHPGLASAEARRELGIGGGPVAGLIGRLSPEKDHSLAFQALRVLAQRFPGVVLLVVGDGPLRARLPEEARSAGVADRVRFLGARNDIPRIMAVLDLLVLSSRTEGLPVAPIEAMAAGRPVVVTDVGGCREVVADGETGYVVPPRDAEALAEAMGRILEDPDLRTRFGAAGRERFQRFFSLEAMIHNYQEIYLGRESERGPVDG